MVRPKAATRKIYIYEYFTADNMLRSAEHFYSGPATRRLKSDLYSLDRKYRLLIYAARGEIPNINDSAEFADRILHTARDLSVTLEYWRLITKGKAIEKIGRAITL